MTQNWAKKNFMMAVAFALFAVLTIWWIALNPLSANLALVHNKYIWGSFYQLVAIWGGICGLVIARHYGGSKSILGKSIILFSCGLFFQSLGQTVYSYYNLFAGIQAPYPSLGDVGYFGSIIFYFSAAVYLARTAGVKVSLKSFSSKIQAILIPLIMLIASYLIFLQGYAFDWSQKLKIFLDFGYPLGQACYVSVAILTLILSRNYLGGLMKKPVIFFLIALIMQYISDFNFLYQANKGTWFVGSYGDYLYCCSYLLMTLALIYVGLVFNKIRNSA